MDNMEIVLLDSFYSSSDDDDAVFDLHLSLLTRKKYNKRRFWISNHIRLREDYGEFRLFNELDEEKFFNYYRMNKTKFFELHAMIEDDIMKQETHLRKSISSLERLAITLRYLATGDSFTSMAYSYRMGLCTVSGIVESVCDAIWNHLQPLVLKEPTENEWKEIAEDFKNIWHFDHCVGAIDGKHVVIKAPPHSGSNFFNYKKTFSIVLLAVVDAKKRFIYIDVGSMGRYSDGGILNDSVFGHKLKTNNLNLPPDEPLCPGGPELPYVFIGDEAFPLLINLMRAYQKSKLTDSRRIFNYRLSRARQVVENSFGILTVRWRVYRKPFECRVELVDKIVNATCVLHNYLINDNSNIFNESEILSTENQLTPLSHSGFRYSNESFFIREEFCRFFNTSGTVPWQITRIQKKLLRM